MKCDACGVFAKHMMPVVLDKRSIRHKQSDQFGTWLIQNEVFFCFPCDKRFVDWVGQRTEAEHRLRFSDWFACHVLAFILEKR